MVFELAQTGDLFDLIEESGGVDEPLAKYFFSRIMRGLQ